MLSKTKLKNSRLGLLPTPVLPKNLPRAELTENALQVLIRRYVRRDQDGQPAETVEEMFWRVAYHVAKVEDTWGGDASRQARDFYEILSSKNFFPNSPTFTGAGTPLGQLAACFTAGMHVTTEQGVKPIAELKIGERVLTHAGRYRPVTELHQRAYAGELLRIKIKLIGTTLEVTPEHPILTPNGWMKAQDLSVHSRVAIGVPRGVSVNPQFDLAALPYAEELEVQTNQTSLRVRQPSSYQNSGRQANWNFRFIEVSPDLARLCGYYVSEGTIGPDERYIRFTFNRDEVEYHEDVRRLVERISGLPVNVSQSSLGNWININVYSRALAAWFETNFGRGSSNKHIPLWLQYAEPEIQNEFLIGLMRGDGLYYENMHLVTGRKTPKMFRSLRLTLSNPALIQQVWQMCLRLGYDAAVRPVDTTYVTPNASDTAQISLPPLQSRQLVKMAFGKDLPEPDVRYLRNTVTRQDDQVFFEVQQIESVDFAGTVYNCEIDEDHSYVTEGVVVHNCFVLPISDDMGRDAAGIFQTLRDAALIQQTGGGNGFSFSRLRPKNSLVKSSAGQATGPVGFLRVYDKAFGEIAQGGSRRGANMAVLRVDHPDIEEFITCKTDENAITNFNISVGITDAFMQAVQHDDDWELRFPDVTTAAYRSFNGTLEQAEAGGLPILAHKRLRARELFNKIVQQAHHNGEPGVLFLDAANRANPVPQLYQLESTNPCVTGDTLIYTEHGLVRADVLARRDTSLKVVTDSRFGAETLLPASKVFATGEKDILRLVTRQGYELRLTANHQVMTSRGWVAAGNLQPGDRLHILNRRGGFGLEGGLEEGRVLGWLVGDGTINVVRAVLSFFGDEKRELAPMFADTVTRLVDRPTGRRSYPVGVVDIPERDEARVMSERLEDWVGQRGIQIGAKHIVPPTVLVGSEGMQRGFLQALFTADGQVNDGGEKGCSVRLSSSTLELLQDVQRLLLNFGIASHIYQNRRLGGYRDMPDGKGGKKEYFHQPQHDLAISKINLITFANEIGFLTEAKQTRLADYLSRMIRGPYQEPFLATVEFIEPDGREMVYDLRQSDTHSFIANGIVVHNCGEQFLGAYENCCLGSINLAQHFGPGKTVDWAKLQRNVELSTRFLDDVVEANAYVPAVPQLKKAALTARRIGLGIMGLADLMYHAGIRYGSPEGQEFAAQVMEFVRFHAMQTSIELARVRGPFPALQGSIYDPQALKWTPPMSLIPYNHDWGRPEVDWAVITDGIRQHGIRNAAQTTVAPTGTIATVAGCEGYGCEPVFALAYIRHVNDNGKDLQLSYASPLFDQALREAGVGIEARETIVQQVLEQGSCQGIEGAPEQIRNVFVVSQDISAEEHVRMQAALQAFVDNSLSKTVNFGREATVEDVATAYKLAWELGCKGITVYVTGSREKVVLETRATASGSIAPEESIEATPAVDTQAEQLMMWHEDKKPRPRKLPGYTFSINTPLGKAFVTINENGGEQPFEVFVNTAKAGSDTAAVSEAIGRLVSYILRLASPVSPRERLREAWRQLAGIGGGRSLGFGPNRVRSLPDGVAQALSEYLEVRPGDEAGPVEERDNGHRGTHAVEHGAEQPFLRVGDLCPECGQAAVINEEGCRKCYACGYSEC